MDILPFALSLFTVINAQLHDTNENVNTVCKNVVNQLDCRRFDYKPVCGSNGVQYSTECEFAKAHCTDPDLKVANQGPCTSGGVPASTMPTTVAPADTTGPPPSTMDTQPPTTDDTPAFTHTTPTFAPVMTSTPIDVNSTPAGTVAPVTSAATMAPVTSAATMAPTTTDPYLSDLCNQVVNTPCGAEVNELCANDGKTYQNYCEFSKGRCYVPGLSIAYSGACSVTDSFTATPTAPARTTLPPSVFDVICRTLELVACLDDGVPVCASDGVTYPTACDFEKAKCKDEKIQIKEC